MSSSKSYSQQPLPDTNVTYRVGPTAGNHSFIPKSPNNVIFAFPGEPGQPFITNIGVFARKNDPLTPANALLLQGFSIALSVAKGTASADLVNWAAGTPSQEGDPKCPGDLSLPCLIRDLGRSNVTLYNNPSPTNPIWKTGSATGPFDAAVEAAFKVDYSLPPNAQNALDAEVEIATFHYGVPPTVSVGQTYTINLPKSPNGIIARDVNNVARTIVNSVIIGGRDFSPDTLQGGSIQIVARPIVNLLSAALANVDGTMVCLKWQLDPKPTNNPLDPATAPYDFCYGVHIFRDGQDVSKVDLTVTETQISAFDFCDVTETNTYQVAVRMKEDPNCQCPADCKSDCGDCNGQIVFSNQLAVSRIPHLLSEISPDNWPYFKPLTELTVSSDFAFHQDCGLPTPSFDGPFTTSATVCSGATPVIKGGTCQDPNELCCSYGTSKQIGTSLWKIEISCSDSDPFKDGNQPFEFIYDGRNNRADTQIVDPFTVRIWYPGTGDGSANAFANLPGVTPKSPDDPLKPRRIPSVYRVALVVVDPAKNLGDATYVVARSQSLPLNFGFRRGDSNRNTAVTLSDVVNLLNFFGSGGNVISQFDCAADVNDSNTFTLSDAVYLIRHVATNPGGPPPPEPFLSGGKPYFGMESSGRPPNDFIITNTISLRCFHYCPCFKAEVKGSGGEDGRRTETGCCICRENTFDPQDKDNKNCDQFKYEP